MDSLYSQYLTERTDTLIDEYDYGFITYRYLSETQVYIVDIYVVPDIRENRCASKMADAVVEKAKKKGCKELVGTVVPSTKNSTISLKVLLGYGMKLDSASHDLIVFKKEI